MNYNLSNWIKSLNLEQISRFEYTCSDFIIRISNSTHPFRSNEPRVLVLDKHNMLRVDNYNWQVFHDVGDKTKPINLNDDGYLILLLIKVVSDIPKFIDRKLELDYFSVCENNRLIEIKNMNLSIDDCEVYEMNSITEKRFERVGKDDRFEIMEINSWYIKYQNSLIKNDYLSTLIPSKLIKTYHEFLSSYTAIGDETKTFKLDPIRTEYLRKNFSIDKYRSSL